MWGFADSLLRLWSLKLIQYPTLIGRAKIKSQSEVSQAQPVHAHYLLGRSLIKSKLSEYLCRRDLRIYRSFYTQSVFECLHGGFVSYSG